MRSPSASSLFTLCVTLLAGSGIHGAGVGDPSPAAPPKTERNAVSVPKLVSWAGSYSGVAERLTLRITDQKQWKELWARHMGDAIEHDSYGEPVAPFVDFDKCMAIAFFDGPTTNVRWMTVDAVDEFPDHLRIRYDEGSYQTMEINEPVTLKPGETIDDVLKREMEKPDPPRAKNDPNSTRPYGIFVVPRSAKAIDFEEDTRSLADPDPIWTHRLRMPAMGK